MPPVLGSEREEARAVMESVLWEDGVAGAVESVTDQAPGGDPIGTNLALLSVLAGVLAEQLRAPVPLATERDDATAVMDRWETVLGQVQGVLNQVSAGVSDLLCK